MESERAQNFNDRLNQWIAGQGFWFQLRYSMLGAGGGGARAAQMLQLTFRLLGFALIVGIGVLIYLFKRTDGEGFRKGIETTLLSEIGAQKGSLSGLQRSQGKLVASKFTATGGDGTFFSSLEARDVNCKMDLLNGFAGSWKMGVLTIAKLDIELRAGAKDAKSAETLGRALFKERPDVEMGLIEAEDATLRWGYSAFTRGSIEHSRMNARQLSPSSWRFQFKGGKFSQNWLRGLDIDEMIVICDREKISFEKATFKDEAGTAFLTGLILQGTERPVLTGVLKVRHLPLNRVLPTAAANFLEGSISGDFRVSGSTNSSEGIAFEGKAILDGDDELTLRDRLPLLRALSGVDSFNNYRRVTFRNGSFHLKSGGGNLTVSEVALKADDLLTLGGQMVIRRPTQAELKKSMEGDPSARSSIFKDQSPSVAAVSPGSDFTLKRAAQGSTAERKDAKEDAANESSVEDRQTENEANERIAAALQFSGSFDATIRGDSFERSEKLRAEFPVDAKTGRIHLAIPLVGALSDLTLKQAEDIHEKGRR